MRVRHVHAKPNEYIAVHRHRPRYQTRQTGGRQNTTIQVPALVIIIGIILLMIYWELVITVALIAGGIYLTYLFRKPLADLFAAIWKKLKH